MMGMANILMVFLVVDFFTPVAGRVGYIVDRQWALGGSSPHLEIDTLSPTTLIPTPTLATGNLL
jgi:hypothetical protein